MRGKIKEYINKWGRQGYEGGIPDAVPIELMKNNLAPSYKAIAIAILSNDNNLLSLGFSPKKSIYYNILKKIELSKKNKL